MNEHAHVVLSSDPPEASFGMPHCRDCRWWEEAVFLPETLDGRIARGECARARARGSVEPNALAFAYESNFWSADLVTAADFGCVQFQPKDDAR